MSNMKYSGVRTKTPHMPAIQNTTLANFMQRLFAADRKAVNPQCRRGHRPAKLQIVRDLGNVEEHLFQVSSHGNFLDRVGELSARDPQARGAARIVSGHQVRAVAQELGYIEAFLDFRNQLLRRSASRLQEIV